MLVPSFCSYMSQVAMQNESAYDLSFILIFFILVCVLVDKSSDKRKPAAATEEQWMNRICRYEAGEKSG